MWMLDGDLGSNFPGSADLVLKKTWNLKRNCVFLYTEKYGIIFDKFFKRKTFLPNLEIGEFACLAVYVLPCFTQIC